MADSSVEQLHILVLGDPECGSEFIRSIEAQVHVESVKTFDEAIAVMNRRTFDLVVCDADDLLQLQGMKFAGEPTVTGNGIDQGVCIVREGGELDWASPKMLKLSENLQKHVCKCCIDAFASAKEELQAGSTQIHGRRFTVTTDNNEYYEVTATPVVDRHNQVKKVVAVVWNATHAKRLRDKFDAIDRAGQELLSLDTQQFSRLDTQERLSLLEQRIRRCTEELLHFDNFEIRVLNRQGNTLELVAFAGMPARIQQTELTASAEGSGICGYVAARGRSYICPDVSKDPRYNPGIENARSSLTVPLRLHDQVVGVANFESAELAAFTEDDRQFAEIFGRYVALALHILELLVTERHTTTGRLGNDVMAEITGPLNDILTDVENLVEDYIGHDDLRHRLRKISENAVTIRESIKDITSQETGLVGARAVVPKHRDPILDGKNVLVADDEDVIRDTVRDVLRGYGCNVSTASDGAAALQLISEQSFDLVLSDIKMPHNTGYEVFAAAKEVNPATPVILTTGFGYDPNHAIVRARREGLAAVLFKPFKVDQLLGEIRIALASATK